MTILFIFGKNKFSRMVLKLNNTYFRWLVVLFLNFGKNLNAQSFKMKMGDYDLTIENDSTTRIQYKFDEYIYGSDRYEFDFRVINGNLSGTYTVADAMTMSTLKNAYFPVNSSYTAKFENNILIEGLYRVKADLDELGMDEEDYIYLGGDLGKPKGTLFFYRALYFDPDNYINYRRASNNLEYDDFNYHTGFNWQKVVATRFRDSYKKSEEDYIIEFFPVGFVQFEGQRILKSFYTDKVPKIFPDKIEQFDDSHSHRMPAEKPTSYTKYINVDSSHYYVKYYFENGTKIYLDSFNFNTYLEGGVYTLFPLDSEIDRMNNPHIEIDFYKGLIPVYTWKSSYGDLQNLKLLTSDLAAWEFQRMSGVYRYLWKRKYRGCSYYKIPLGHDVNQFASLADLDVRKHLYFSLYGSKLTNSYFNDGVLEGPGLFALWKYELDSAKAFVQSIRINEQLSRVNLDLESLRYLTIDLKKYNTPSYSSYQKKEIISSWSESLVLNKFDNKIFSKDSFNWNYDMIISDYNKYLKLSELYRANQIDLEIFKTAYLNNKMFYDRIGFVIDGFELSDPIRTSYVTNGMSIDLVYKKIWNYQDGFMKRLNILEHYAFSLDTSNLYYGGLNVKSMNFKYLKNNSLDIESMDIVIEVSPRDRPNEIFNFFYKYNQKGCLFFVDNQRIDIDKFSSLISTEFDYDSDELEKLLFLFSQDCTSNILFSHDGILRSKNDIFHDVLNSVNFLADIKSKSFIKLINSCVLN